MPERVGRVPSPEGRWYTIWECLSFWRELALTHLRRGSSVIGEQVRGALCRNGVSRSSSPARSSRVAFILVKQFPSGYSLVIQDGAWRGPQLGSTALAAGVGSFAFGLFR